ncbi:MAG TPA: tRNA preQ1(34) S-adenosylmethionine ribosyltransferase-isomerase QueA [Thermomicrobiales bacterium]|nr:tRNA preQ1(34) S-adenosylmethionine ribosyltransferase-isomerase QueA [Thermomicrobiales bacterium]
MTDSCPDVGRPIPVAQFDYDLPPELIAQAPIEPRDASRLLVIDRTAGRLHDRQFRDLPQFLTHGDLIVVNDTRVFPARLAAVRGTGGGVELLLLRPICDTTWLAMARPGRRLREGERLLVLDRHGEQVTSSVTIERRQGGQFVVSLESDTIEQFGRIPLPPYIRTAICDPSRYQTVYADEQGSAAAPTAGMHFTTELMDACVAAGATFARVTLHVGLDTFQPLKTDDARKHHMHSEWFRISEPDDIRSAKAGGRRVIAIGTTSVRTLESAAERILDDRASTPIDGFTNLFITPGYSFNVVDAMVTNFHLPRTTLMLLVSAFAGHGLIREAYEHAIRERYRFFSFGDAMLIV